MPTLDMMKPTTRNHNVGQKAGTVERHNLAVLTKVATACLYRQMSIRVVKQVGGLVLPTAWDITLEKDFVGARRNRRLQFIYKHVARMPIRGCDGKVDFGRQIV